MGVLVSKVVSEFWFVAHLALTWGGSECRHLREEALQQAANQGRFHQTEHANISTSKKEKFQHDNKVKSHQTDLYKHAIEVIQKGKHDNDKVVLTKHHFEPLWQYFKITCDPFRLLLLRYESSTLILFKELSSSIFQSCQSVSEASVTPVQISTLCNI